MDEQQQLGITDYYVKLDKDDQPELFAAVEVEDWRREWQGMPEYEIDDLVVFHQITVKFPNQERMNEFSKLIGQDVTKTTKGIWHPKAEKGFTLRRNES